MMGKMTPLGRVRGLGSARDGTRHWWAQRLTAAALVPLSIWFVASLIFLTGADHATVTAWLGSPVVAVLMVLLIVALFHHAQLGLQVVIEDYVHTEWLKLGLVVLGKLAAFTLAAFSVFAVLRMALAG